MIILKDENIEAETRFALAILMDFP